MRINHLSALSTEEQIDCTNIKHSHHRIERERDSEKQRARERMLSGIRSFRKNAHQRGKEVRPRKSLEVPTVTPIPVSASPNSINVPDVV
jgi:hypothetical protein